MRSMSAPRLEPRQQAEYLLEAINDGTGSVRTLLVPLLMLALYVFIIVAGTMTNSCCATANGVYAFYVLIFTQEPW